jgi:hypothetical protein
MESVYASFKHDLLPEQKEESFSRGYLSKPPRGREYDETQYQRLVIEYLKDLREHADQILENTYTPALTIPKEYIVTVPGVWPENQQQRMRTCAEKAGLGSGKSPHIITELDAAGIYALQSMHGGVLKRDDAFVLCDAGGW